MFFELIECERYQMTDLPDKLPLAITKDNTCKMGAVSGSRYVRNILGAKYEADASYLSYKQFYDFGPFSEKKGEQLAIRDSIIFLDWLISLQILEGTKEILYLDHNKGLSHIMLQEIGGKISELEKMLEKYSNQVYLQNEISNIMQALNVFFVEIFIGKTLKEIIEEEEMQELDTEEKKIGEIQDEAKIEEKKISGETKEKIFSALKTLIIEWYDINLNYI